MINWYDIENVPAVVGDNIVYTTRRGGWVELIPAIVIEITDDYMKVKRLKPTYSGNEVMKLVNPLFFIYMKVPEDK